MTNKGKGQGGERERERDGEAGRATQEQRSSRGVEHTSSRDKTQADGQRSPFPLRAGAGGPGGSVGAPGPDVAAG